MPPTGIIGMIHLPPLPGAPGWSGGMDPILDRARSDARALAEGGVDAVLVENFGDTPFQKTVPPATVASMTAAVGAVREVTDLPVGVNVLRNDAAAALAVAAATGARFIRVNVHTGGMFTDQGWIEGAAADTIRLRERSAPAVAIVADVLVKHATPPPGLTLEAAATDAVHRGRADALVVSGEATGAPTRLDDVRAVKAVVNVPVLVGSGARPEMVAELLAAADGVIVGSALMEGGRAGGPVDPDRVRQLVEAAGR
ncbi:MAG: BtpA/SgcQ family protein [Longimicrobiales bacterium]|nr:BtpA/SgcQ family protein [Longimicrobiales bacterium]